MDRMPLAERAAIPDGYQDHWYRHVCQFVRGKTVLDVGAGSGCGTPILLAGGAASVRAIDPLPCGPGVERGTVDQEPMAGYDWVLAVDVIEHVDDDFGFFWHLLRCARVGVFISTPNWNVSHARNPHHVREYTPVELAALLAGRRIRTWSSDGACAIKETESLAHTNANFGVVVFK